MRSLTDQYGRSHTYLRVSVTDRCNYRCRYCLPESGIQWKPKKEILTYEEMARLVHIFADLGITHVRITGGEPTLRLEIGKLIKAISSVDKIENIAMTTNGHRLEEKAIELVESGLNRLNVSLDTLNPAHFNRLTRGGTLSKVLAGLKRAKQVGMGPIKINTVLMKNENEHEILPLMQYCAKNGFEIRFIEYMPFESRWHECLSEQDVKEIILKRYTLTPAVNKAIGLGPAQRLYVPEIDLHIGFISPLSNKFCDQCNRLRLGADGFLRNCLAHEDTPSLREMLRGPFTDEDIKRTIQSMVFHKKEGHLCEVSTGKPFEGIMTQIGG